MINLAADKSAVFREIARVLRPGGRLGVSDIVAENALTPEERAERGSYVGCIAGALSFSEYEAGLREAGLEDISITPTHQETAGMISAIIRARKSLRGGPPAWAHPGHRSPPAASSTARGSDRRAPPRPRRPVARRGRSTGREVAADERRADRARRVHRRAADRAADERAERDGTADGDRRALTDRSRVGRDGDDHEHQEERQDDLPDERLGVAAGRLGHPERHIAERHPQDQRCRDRARDLGHPVGHDPRPGSADRPRSRP